MNTQNISPKTNPRHEKFISEVIRHGDKVRAYKAAYPKASDEAARVASSRLMQRTYIKEKLDDAHREVHIGLANDKLAFIHQELKIINQKRKLLLGIITGARPATVNELMKAIRLDNELAEQQAQLLGYGSMKPVKNVPAKNAKTVTKMNNELAPVSPAVASAKEGIDEDWTEEGYPNDFPGFVTNVTGYTCNPSTGVQAGLTDECMEEPKEYPLLEQLLKQYELEQSLKGKLHFK